MSTWERHDVVVRTTATGHELTAPVFHCRGLSERPLAYLQANVHGGELQGNAALLALFELLEESRRGDRSSSCRASTRSRPTSRSGTTSRASTTSTREQLQQGLSLPHGPLPLRVRRPATSTSTPSRGPSRRPAVGEIREDFRAALRAALDAIGQESGLGRGLAARVRPGDPADGVEADVVMDLHTGDRAPRYLYVPEGAVAAASAFGFPFVLEVPPASPARSTRARSSPGTTWSSLPQAGRDDVPRFVDGFTVELGSMNAFSLAREPAGRQRIASALRYYGVLDGEPDLPPHEDHRLPGRDYRPLYAPAGGLVDPAVEPGDAGPQAASCRADRRPLSMPAMPPRASTRRGGPRARGRRRLLFHAFSSVPKGARLVSVMTRTRTL